MTKRDHKSLIMITRAGSTSCMYNVEYLDIHCGTFTDSWKKSEIKEHVYNELKKRGLLAE